MNPASPSLPGLPSLYWRDLVIRYAVHVCVVPLLIAIGVMWATQPVPGAEPPAVLTPERQYAPWVAAGALVISVLAAIVLVWRFLRVRSILRDGTAVKGIVEEADTVLRASESAKVVGNTRRNFYTYHVTLRYTVNGLEKTVRQRLPNSAVTYGLSQGGEADLLVLPSLPDKPLIRSVYLGRI